MKGAEHIGKVMVVAGGAGLIAEMFYKPLGQYSNIIKMVLIGGAVLFLVGYFM